MNPMLVSALGSLIRFALAYCAGYLTYIGAWEAEDAEAYVTAVVPSVTFAALALGWSLYQKWQARRVTLVALAAAVLSEHEAEGLVALGEAPPVTTPATIVPVATVTD